MKIKKKNKKKKIKKKKKQQQRKRRFASKIREKKCSRSFLTVSWIRMGRANGLDMPFLPSLLLVCRNVLVKPIRLLIQTA